MPDTVHALLVATDGTITDLRLSTSDPTQRAQLHQALQDNPEILSYVQAPDGTGTAVLAAENSEGQPMNMYAAIAWHLLLDQEALIAEVQGPALFIGFTSKIRVTDLSDETVRTIRTVEPDTPGAFPAAVRTGP
ncbi:hypothetical protein [Streptomyces sp. NPDC002851]